MAVRIRDALERDLFRLHCQPILDLATGEVSPGELLLRMMGADGELIAPGAFLAVAERLGLIHAIDRWVVAEAIRMLAERPGACDSRSTSPRVSSTTRELLGVIDASPTRPGWIRPA